jgi:hypothetical protein
MVLSQLKDLKLARYARQAACVQTRNTQQFLVQQECINPKLDKLVAYCVQRVVFVLQEELNCLRDARWDLLRQVKGPKLALLVPQVANV